MERFLFFNLTTPLVMFWIASIITREYTVDMNSGQGYRGPMAMLSQEHWEYAQRLAPQVMRGYGLVSGIIIFIWDVSVLMLELNAMLGMLAGMFIGSITVTSAFIRIERLIYEEYGD